MGLWEAGGRKRRHGRSWWRLIRWLVILGLIIGAGAYSYDIGGELAQQEVRVLEARIGELNVRNDDLQGQLDSLAVSTRRATGRANSLAAQVPSPTERRLLDTIRERLDAGLEPERLSFVLGAASNTRECFGAPVTRRFVVRTALTGEGNDTVTFADRSLLVTASGATSRSEGGQVQAWFDPARPITATFRHIGGAATEMSGVLPLTHSVVVGDVEYRFGLVAGARAFVDVTADTCRYP